MPYITAEGRGGPPQPGFFGGWLGRTYDPLFMLRDPNAPGFDLPELSLGAGMDSPRLLARKHLTHRLTDDERNVQRERRLQDMDGFQAKAFDLLTSPDTQRAFRLDQEPSPVRDAYGRNIYGQSVLLARRLIEAGTRVACISWAPDANATWDTHGGNFTKLKNDLLPQLDAAIASLLTDLVDRGLLERTLVVVMGEFGRSPKVNASAGRDHWNFCYSLMLAGGGIKGGFIYGASDRIGGRPSSCPVRPADIIATIYHCLGIPNTMELRDRLHRPYELVPWGSPIHELMA
jgi:arylsulfatase A-like enzyme